MATILKIVYHLLRTGSVTPVTRNVDTLLGE